MSLISFNVNQYCQEVVYQVYLAVDEITLELTKEIRKRAASVPLNKLDREQGVDLASGVRSGRARILDITMRQGGRILSNITAGTTRNSLVSIFYEYGTGKYGSPEANRRWQHEEPSEYTGKGPVRGRPLKDPGSAPKGRYRKGWSGEEYRVITGAGGTLTHKTRGRRKGKALGLDVIPYHFVRNATYRMRPKLHQAVLKAVKQVNPKAFMKVQGFTIR